MTEHKLKTTQNPFSLNPEPKLNTFNPAPPQQQNRQFHNFVPKQSYHTGAMNNPPMQHSMQRNSDPLETVLGPFPCVRIRGLPFDSNLEDVLVFFQGLVVLDVVVLPHSYNHQGTVGEAFVVFGNPMDFQMALQR
jgi:heterogeneous nuclear ribonucleoprotein F/H